MAKAMFGLHLYHWHPYELQAFLCGIFGGVILGVQLYALLWWLKERSGGR